MHRSGCVFNCGEAQALANEEVEARRKAGQTEAKIWTEGVSHVCETQVQEALERVKLVYVAL
jgi:hypothetical protein